MRWKHRFSMRDLLSDDTSDENAVRVGKELSRRMSESGLFTDSAGNLLIVGFQKAQDSDEINSLLDAFWDYCDVKKIWIPFDER